MQWKKARHSPWFGTFVAILFLLGWLGRVRAAIEGLTWIPMSEGTANVLIGAGGSGIGIYLWANLERWWPPLRRFLTENFGEYGRLWIVRAMTLYLIAVVVLGHVVVGVAVSVVAFWRSVLSDVTFREAFRDLVLEILR